ncbi:YtxH domain-containing protein [Lactococcus kimchii]|uniref:YtxH domain-containing protein n=1 Tax=Lactococcus sp. S-13 TaxID=2507158 RepID=UPI0010238774|nr:YtxH domain-containing protein [Lactococcus sp. S-13]RZI48686.1 YtxH domain-containing protein [Lactococcus sp. S-13]
MSKKTGFLVGALVGAAAALFLAPKKGSELREDAGKIYDDFKENPQETLNELRDNAVDFSSEKFTEIKEKFDSGEISADKAKEFLISKRDLIMEKVDSGELSKDSVVDFFNETRDAIMEKINSAKESGEELFDENQATDEEDSFISDDAAAVVAKFNDAEETEKEDISSDSLAEEARKIAEKAKELTNHPSEEW